MNKQRLGILILALIGMLTTFMPWATVSFLGMQRTIKGTDGDGWITIVLFLVVLILTLVLGKIKASIKGAALLGVIIPSVICFIIGAINIFSINGNSFGNVKYGLYVLTIVPLFIIIISFILKDKANSEA